MNIKVSVKGNVDEIYPTGTSLLEISKAYANDFKSPVLLARVNHDVRELSVNLYNDVRVEFLDVQDDDGFRAYQKGVSFLLAYAIKEVLGDEAVLTVGHSVQKHSYCEINNGNVEITQNLLDEIKCVMCKAVEMKLPIEKHTFPFEEALRLAGENSIIDKVFLTKYKHSANITLYKMGDYYNYILGLMPPDSGCLYKFDLVKEFKGFMLLFPSRREPEKLEEYKPIEKISQVFMEYSSWTKILKVDTVSALNECISEGKVGEIIRISEALHEKRIAQISDMILNSIDDVKMVLIAGPSSSGKTTFAQRLCIQLRVNGITPHVISLDNYFVERENTPLDEFGRKNYESVYAIDIELFNKQMNDIFDGNEVMLPTYSFIDGKKDYKGNTLKLGHKEIIVIEGIHGLNEMLSCGIPRNNKFKIYVSALAQLNVDALNRITTTDSRMIRRIVRDSRYRGINPETTISMWDSVTKGEEMYIFPYQQDVDAMFNSALIYELSVLKQYIEPLLFRIDKTMPQYSEAKRLIKLFDCFLGVSGEEIPNNSIIREFIGGSCFKT